jgi:hypothetical protein
MTAEIRQTRLAASLLAASLAVVAVIAPHPTHADPANLVAETSGSPGATGRLVLAQKTYLAAMRQGNAVMLVSAIRLARSVATRDPIGWTRTTAGEADPKQPTGRTAPANPAGPETLAIVQSLAGEDPSLQDLVYELDAQRPHQPRATANQANADLGGGQTDLWRIVLSGQVSAEIGLVGDGDSPLGMTITDETGVVVCARPPNPDPALCRFTPARNGFFQVLVHNPGKAWNSYHLLGN